jgi:hypothetical protein
MCVCDDSRISLLIAFPVGDVQIQRVVAYWSVGRIIWGVASVMTAAVDWANHAESWQFAIGLVSIALIAEILPFLYAPTVDTAADALLARSLKSDDADLLENESPLLPRDARIL